LGLASGRNNSFVLNNVFSQIIALRYSAVQSRCIDVASHQLADSAGPLVFYSLFFIKQMLLLPHGKTGSETKLFKERHHPITLATLNKLNYNRETTVSIH
jgi:hypothetical protein